MAKPGPKPKGIVNMTWSPDFAYAVGLLVADGCLSSNGRHIDFTSKDEEQLKNFLRCLDIEHIKISDKDNGRGGRCGRVQFGDVLFYRFLESIGLTSRKSKTIGVVEVPDKFFFDFLRGVFDGDGCFYSFWDKRWKSSFMFYTVFSSASREHIDWLQKRIQGLIDVKGHTCEAGSNREHQLKYAKTESMKVLGKMYYNKDVTYLSRKRLKIEEALGIMGEQLPN